MNTVIERAAILKLQAEISKYPQATLETTHYFADGMYCRELFRPADTTIIGKVHRREHFYIVVSGEVTISGGGEPERVKAPKIFVSKPGTKRAVYAHVDSVCLTIHRTDKTDLDDIERELIESDDTALFNASNKLKFDAHAFRALTQKIIDNEKPGFWSEWTEEEQKLYASGDWRAFSTARGYSQEQMADYQLWLDMTADAFKNGINPYSFTIDLATAAALRNLSRAGSHEILKSTRLPKVVP
jgi:mannose-6-phosphate isomerase-like protein (cupin superfamily)